MEYVIYLVIVAIIMCYWNLYLIIRKEAPEKHEIIINNYITESTEKPKSYVKAEEAIDRREVPIETKGTTNIKTLQGSVNLTHEALDKDLDVSDQVKKIKSLKEEQKNV